jgi:Uma2 family endonuclease
MAIREATSTPTAPLPRKASYEDYAQWSGEHARVEWVDGEIIVHMPPTDAHQSVLLFLAQLMSLFVHLFRLGRVAAAPFEMRLAPGKLSREPDILFVASARLDRLTGERLEGPADLAVEIVSDDSVRRDRRDKFAEYRQAGIREYWIVDPRPGKSRIDVHGLNSGGEYELLATEDDERIHSQVLPGFWVRPAWLWQADRLDALTVFCEMAGLPDAFAEQLRQRLKAGFGAAPGEA